MADAFLGRYARILTTDGAWRFSTAGWFARLVRSTAQIGTILLVSARTDTFAAAGLASGAVVVGAAVTGPLWSRTADRYGQSRVLPLAVVTLAIAGTALLVTVDLGAATPLVVLAALLVGAGSLDAGALSRARWMHLLPDVGDRHTALALESVLDEFTFVIGPPIVTLVAAAVSPELGFATGAGVTVLGYLAVLAQRSTEPRPAPLADRAARAWLPLTVLALLPGYVGIGLIFGSVDLTAVGVSADVESPWVAGVLLAVFAVGSVASALATGVIGRRGTPLSRLLVAGLLFAVVMPLFALVHGPIMFGVASLLGGVATTPLLIASASLIEATTDRAIITLAMSWPTVAMSLGVTLGSVLSGTAVDAGDTYGGLWVPVLASALVLATTIGNVLARARRPEHDTRPERDTAP